MEMIKYKNQIPDIRYLYDMKEVIYDQKWLATAPNLELYYMYRAVKREAGLRYDITVIPFQMLGQEFVKTKGHQHPDKFAELYEVLKGQAMFLMQKCPENGFRAIEDVYAVEGKKGDKVFVPPHYGHVTINPGPDDLKMSNWVADNFKSDYSLFLKKQGAAYYYTKTGWIKNKNYGKVPEIRFEEPNKNIPKDLKRALCGRGETGKRA